MENRKWLKRKYPISFVKVNRLLNDEYLSKFKKERFRIAVLKKDIGIHKPGEFIIFKRSNPVNSYNYPMHYGIAKCSKGYTTSGYHSIDVFEDDINEITS